MNLLGSHEGNVWIFILAFRFLRRLGSIRRVKVTCEKALLSIWVPFPLS